MNISAKLEQRPTILHVLMVNPLGYLDYNDRLQSCIDDVNMTFIL